ncbi:MAG: RNA polymerase sigma factor [Candidatus Zixiibacteriota bacterium]
MKADWETLHRARAGDESSWRDLWRLHLPRLKALAYLVTGSVPTSDDIARETLIRAIEARVRNENGSLEGFLGTIAYRLALKEVKRHDRNIDITGFDTTDKSDIPLESILKNEREKILAETIRDLDSEHGEALILRFYGELSYEEMAEILGVPIGTAKSRVFYAVQSCRKKMREKGLII